MPAKGSGSIQKINSIVVTGFLGAGKTTLMKKLIQRYSKSKVAILVNDFGQEATDGYLLEQKVNNLSKVYEISRGSIFCSCKISQFVQQLKKIAESNYDYLLLETSGMSDPTGFQMLLEKYGLANRFNINQVWVVFDAARSYQLSQTLPVITRQIQQADILIINKSDLVDSKDLLRAVTFIEQENPSAEIFQTSFCDINLDLIEEKRSFQESGTLESYNRPENRPGSCYIAQSEKEGMLFYQTIKMIAKEFSTQLYRLKGFCLCDGQIIFLSSDGIKLKEEPIEDKEVPFLGVTIMAPWSVIKQIEHKILQNIVI